MAEEIGTGEMTLSDIIAEMKKPARDQMCIRDRLSALLSGSAFVIES